MTSNTPSPALRPEPMPEWEPKVSTPHRAIPKDLTIFSKVERFFCNFAIFLHFDYILKLNVGSYKI